MAVCQEIKSYNPCVGIFCQRLINGLSNNAKLTQADSFFGCFIRNYFKVTYLLVVLSGIALNCYECNSGEDCNDDFTASSDIDVRNGTDCLYCYKTKSINTNGEIKKKKQISYNSLLHVVWAYCW